MTYTLYSRAILFSDLNTLQNNSLAIIASPEETTVMRKLSVFILPRLKPYYLSPWGGSELINELILFHRAYSTVFHIVWRCCRITSSHTYWNMLQNYLLPIS